MKRRDFIEKTMLGTAGIAVGSSFTTFNASVKGANDKIVLALIGAGARGTGTIINTCKVNKNVVIKTVCDVNDLKATKTLANIHRLQPTHTMPMILLRRPTAGMTAPPTNATALACTCRVHGADACGTWSWFGGAACALPVAGPRRDLWCWLCLS